MYHIHPGALQRLSRHDHVEARDTCIDALYDLVELIIESCSHCKAIADAFEEGFEAGESMRNQAFADCAK